MHTAVAHLQAQLKEIQRNPVGGFAVDLENGDLFTWKIHFAGPEGSYYHPGIYKAHLTFTQEFPFKPPVLTVKSKFWHPNVYDNGEVCMSILHQPGVDEMNELETASMRYSPVVTIEKILISFISLLSDPDPSEAGAPANVDALAMYRKNKEKFVLICQDNAKKSITELPPDFVMPQPKDFAKQQAMMQVQTSDGYDYDYSGPSSTQGSQQQKAGSPASGGGAADYSAQLKRIKDIVPEPPKTDEELMKMLEKYRGDVDRVMEGLWD